MKIYALFGVTCVGKSTIGSLLSDRLGCNFYDMDEEIKRYYGDTLNNIYADCMYPRDKDEKKAKMFSHMLALCREKGRDAVIAVSPMYHYVTFRNLITQYKVIAIELQDTAENIAKRMIDTDDNDELIEESPYSNRENLSDARYFITRYKKTFAHFPTKYRIDGKTAQQAAVEMEELIRNLPAEVEA